jgi:type II pantothenate kinase
MIVGIDIGSTTTKIVVIKENSIIAKTKTKALDAITSATGAFGKILMENNLDIHDIRKIIITGVGASNIKDDIFGIPTERIDEITAIGVGGKYLSKRDNILITNIGTGTAIIETKNGKISHLGGTGVGGGTIIGLSKLLLDTTNFDHILNLADYGNIEQVDLLVKDIINSNIGFLNKEITASNFGKIQDTTTKEDLSFGIINMVFQVIGMISVFAAKSINCDTIIVTGNGSKNNLGQKILLQIADMYKINFEFPEDAEYTTAIGAALPV